MERDPPTFQFDRQIPGHPPQQQGRNLVCDQNRAAQAACPAILSLPERPFREMKPAALHAHAPCLLSARARCGRASCTHTKSRQGRTQFLPCSLCPVLCLDVLTSTCLRVEEILSNVSYLSLLLSLAHFCSRLRIHTSTPTPSFAVTTDIAEGNWTGRLERGRCVSIHRGDMPHQIWQRKVRCLQAFGGR